MTRSVRRVGLFFAAVAAAAVFVALTPQARVAEAATGDNTGIAVTGTGYVMATPDIARISLGVQFDGTTVAQARDGAANAMQKVQDAVRAQGVEAKDIQTQYLNISPRYESNRGEQPRIIGYTVSNQVQVTVRKLDSASAVLDAAVAAGGDATRVNGIHFTIEDPDRVLAQARTDAVKNAKAHADTLASAAGVGVGKPKSIVESSGGGFPYPMPPMAERSAAGGVAPATPVNPGEQRLSVTVSIVYEIS